MCDILVKRCWFPSCMLCAFPMSTDTPLFVSDVGFHWHVSDIGFHLCQMLGFTCRNIRHDMREGTPTSDNICVGCWVSRVSSYDSPNLVDGKCILVYTWCNNSSQNVCFILSTLCFSVSPTLGRRKRKKKCPIPTTLQSCCSICACTHYMVDPQQPTTCTHVFVHVCGGESARTTERERARERESVRARERERERDRA